MASANGSRYQLMNDFGDHVRIKKSAETIAAEVAGLEGDVYGFTTPSITGVEVIGGAPDDHAINVYFKALSTDHWFRPDLVEFLHHNVGMEMEVGNARAVRQPDGSWAETVINSKSPKARNDPKPRISLLSRLLGLLKRQCDLPSS